MTQDPKETPKPVYVPEVDTREQIDMEDDDEGYYDEDDDWIEEQEDENEEIDD